MIFTFNEDPEAKVEFHVWEAQLTVSGNGRMATLTNWNWNVGIKAGETYKMILVITGAARLNSFAKIFY